MSQTYFECLLVKDNSILLARAAKVRLLKLQDERDEDQPNLTRAQKTTYPANKQAKEEVACVGRNRSLQRSLQHMRVRYPAER
ncbi:uncharacterized protein TNCV_166671 [Trichonephila clavipes]|nr:uncharacterized protein TNCV_166671 [Trichonephila clavipes]